MWKCPAQQDINVPAPGTKSAQCPFEILEWRGEPAVGGSAPPQSKQSVSCCDSWGVLRARFRQHSNLILMTFFTVNMWKLARIYPSGYHVTDLWKRYDITDTCRLLFSRAIIFSGLKEPLPVVVLSSAYIKWPCECFSVTGYSGWVHMLVEMKIHAGVHVCAGVVKRQHCKKGSSYKSKVLVLSWQMGKSAHH